VRLRETGRSAPHPGTQRPQPQGRKQQTDWVTRMASRRRKTLVVCRLSSVVCRLPRLPRGHPLPRMPHTATTITALESQLLRKTGTAHGTAGSGRGRRKRTHHGHLVGGLLHRTSGAVSGPEKQTQEQSRNGTPARLSIIGKGQQVADRHPRRAREPIRPARENPVRRPCPSSCATT